MLPEFQRDQLDYGLAIQGSLRAGFTLVDPLVLQLGVRNWWFPSDSGYGRATMLGGGLRLEPVVGSLGRFFIDGNAGAGLTGDFTRFTFDAGIGYELAVSRELGLGPFARYGQLVTASSDVDTDPKYWSAGLSVTLRFPPAPPPPPPPPPPPVVAPPPPPPPKVEPPKDTDADGVVDKDDGCPTTPAGANPDPERAGCPDGDDDNDGVLNHADKCPAQHQGMFPDPERPGCPAPDRDNDSVPDATDACPDKPGAPHTDPKKNGCPGLVKVEGGQIRILKPVFFATNQDTILAKSFPLLQAMANALKATPEIKKTSIEGHTDGQGKPDYNLDLSRRRAESVKQFLIKNGIDEARLETKGFGDTKPLGSNKTNLGRSVNRRVEFVIVDPPQNPAPAEKSASPSIAPLPSPPAPGTPPPPSAPQAPSEPPPPSPAPTP